jgi:hypothetical protein
MEQVQEQEQEQEQEQGQGHMVHTQKFAELHTFLLASRS